MHVIKRDGTRVPFDRNKVAIAIRKANYEINGYLSEDKIQRVVGEVRSFVYNKKEATVEEIQDEVISRLGTISIVVANVYSEYRETKKEEREDNSTDKSINKLMEGTNIIVGKENSNKNPMLLSTQRDLIAGEVSKDIVRRKMYPKHLMKAHDEGIIHIHK